MSGRGEAGRAGPSALDRVCPGPAGRSTTVPDALWCDRTTDCVAAGGAPAPPSALAPLESAGPRGASAGAVTGA
eukprot:scaffold28376_cov62-Isochrysis_galbana.AAC.1